VKKVGKIAGILAGVYAIAYLTFFLVEDRFIFFSESLPQNHVFEFNQNPLKNTLSKQTPGIPLMRFCLKPMNDTYHGD
jgi:hypothetical protein